MNQNKKTHSAQQQLRNEKGHFIKPATLRETSSISEPSENQSTIEHKPDNRTLLNAHLSNPPLYRITQLLEEIKNQQPLRFDIKSVLLLAGILLFLITFGIIGATHAFCDKGDQSILGRFIQLQILDNPQKESLISRITNGSQTPSAPHNRVSLITQNGSIYHILGLTPNNITNIPSAPFIITGEVNECHKTITLKDVSAIQQLRRGN